MAWTESGLQDLPSTLLVVTIDWWTMELPNDPILLEMTPEFVDSWLAELDTVLPTIIVTYNYEELYRFGHTLKGSALQFGFHALAEIGMRMMEHAQQRNWNFNECIDRMRQLLAQILSLYNEHQKTLRDVS